MSIYRKILLAVDLNADSIAVGRRARELAALMGAELTVLHVVEYVPVEPVGENMMPPVPLLDELASAARQRLVTLCADIGVDVHHQRVEVGTVKGEIVRVARAMQCDLIVLGARERHGLSIFVNLTEDTVLHAASCDVLAVRVSGERSV
ncbi:MAG TPA: universal stress protein [Steroidobacteraceae bacterium]|jgi:universal stress protein A|nr:universal stress protein [Steroidobacteraceae bacterium]